MLEFAEEIRYVRLIFILNGEDVEVWADESSPLSFAVDTALRDSHNTGRPLGQWEVRDEKGVTLPMGQSVAQLNFGAGDRMFLMPRVGAGGRAGAMICTKRARVEIRLDQSDEEDEEER